MKEFGKRASVKMIWPVDFMDDPRHLTACRPALAAKWTAFRVPVFVLLLCLVHPFLVASMVAADHPPSPSVPQVQVRFEMDWWSRPAHGQRREISVVLTLRGGKDAPLTLRLVEGIPSVATMLRGVYQLTTTSPLVVNRQAYGWSIELPLVEPVNTVRLSQENAVRLRLGDDVEPYGASSKPLLARSQSDSAARAEIVALLDRWAAAIRSRNLKALASCYAPRLSVYLQRTDVSREEVQAQKRKQFGVYPRVKRFDLTNTALSISHDRASGSAVTAWDFRGEDISWHGRTELHFDFIKVNAHWVIVAERERGIPERDPARTSETAASRLPQ